MRRREKIVMAPDWTELLRKPRLDGVEAVYAFQGGEVVASSRSSEVRRVLLPGGGSGGRPRIVFIKKYWTVSRRQLWSGALRGTFFGRSKVRREFENLSRLRAWGL